ncbi:MAG: hypothetical protein ACRD8O_15050, partial [Bryobacteraceae bacterium]
FTWGWILDRMSARGIDRFTAVRRLMFAATWLSLPLALVPFIPSFWLVMAELFLAMFTTVGFVIPTVSYAVHVYTRAHSGLIAGLGAGSYGASVALFMPLFGRLYDQHRWPEAHAIAALLPAVGFAAWCWIHRGTNRA